MPDTCESCRYFYMVPDNAGTAICRRNPPIPILSAQLAATDQYAKAMWPVVHNDWWCGEYKNKADTEAVKTKVKAKRKSKGKGK